MTWIRFLFPLLLVSPILAVYEHSNQDEDNQILSVVFWILLAIGIFPIIYLYLPPAIASTFILNVKQRIDERRMAPLQLLWRHASFPADFTQVRFVSPRETQQIFSLMGSLLAIPVLKLREVVLTGIYTQDVNSKEKESKETVSTGEENPEVANAMARGPLAKELFKNRIQPIYDNPFAFTEPQVYENKGKRGKKKSLHEPWSSSYSRFVVFEISDRFPAHHNDNKFRVVFDVWNKSQRDHFVLFGVGPELPSYCKRVFELKEMSPPEFHATDPLLREMDAVGIRTWYYRCTYKSRKFKDDKRRSFVLAFHNILIEDDHPFSSTQFSQFHTDPLEQPFARMMFLAHELDAPVFCADPEIYFLLSLLHTSFHYIFDSPSTFPKVIIDAIHIALDRMEVITLWPPDAIHIFALQMIRFCGKFMEEKSSQPRSPFQQHLSYHFTAKKKTKLSYEQLERKAGGLDNPASVGQSLRAYTESSKKVLQAVDAAKTTGLTRLDWNVRLLEEAQFLGYAYIESTFFTNVPFEHFYSELQSSMDELRYRREEKEVDYDWRRYWMECGK